MLAVADGCCGMVRGEFEEEEEKEAEAEIGE
jgi:hypothetical protein